MNLRAVNVGLHREVQVHFDLAQGHVEHLIARPSMLAERGENRPEPYALAGAFFSSRFTP